ncbi:MAG: hypothetical protein ACYTFM_05645, partial [Planctomycetota bacterium]
MAQYSYPEKNIPTLILTLTLSIILSINSLAIAEDESPPGFAGAMNTGYVRWEFDQPAIETPSEFAYIPGPSSPTFYVVLNDSTWNQTLDIINYVGETRFWWAIPDGWSNDYVTMYVQITCDVGDSFDVVLELWEGPGTGYIIETTVSPSATISLDGGKEVRVYEVTYPPSGDTPGYCDCLLQGGSGGTIYELVADVVHHSDSTPPTGAGRGVSYGVQLLGDPNWIQGTTHTAEDGNDRGLIFTAHVKDNDGSIDLTSVTYGGQSMTKVIEKASVSTSQAYAVAYFLDEADIAAASGSTFVPTWAETPDNVGYSSAFFSGVDQVNPLGYTASDSSEVDYLISTNPIPTNYGDMVILVGTSVSSGSFDPPQNGFTEALELTMSTCDGVVGYKQATVSDETPAINHSTASSKVIIGFVLQTEGGSTPDTTPPTPTTSTWLIPPTAISFNTISMTANTATDPSGVKYYFDETSGNPGGNDSGWQSNNLYADSGLSPETQYTYRVKTRDTSYYHNEGNFSTSESATTTNTEFNNCPDGDLDNNCVVDENDLDIFANQWLDTGGCSEPNCADIYIDN